MAANNIVPFGMNGANGQNVIGQKDIDVFNGLPVIGASPTAPSIAIGGAAGSGATVSVVGSNLGGTITYNSGTGILGSGVIHTLTLANSFTFPTNSTVVLTPSNSAAALLGTVGYISASSATAFSTSVTSGTAISTTFKWNYIVVGW